MSDYDMIRKCSRDTLMNTATHEILIRASELSVSDLRAVLAGPVRPILDGMALSNVAKGREILDRAISSGQPIYGATTGVGAMKHTEHRHWDDISQFNHGLALAHQIAVGEEVDAGVARLMLVLRLNTISSGRVGVTQNFARMLATLIENDLLPVVNARGSVGCGDLGQMGQLAAIMVGHGQASLAGCVMPANMALEQIGLEPYRMQTRESLAAVGSNSYGLARSVSGALRSVDTLRHAIAQAAITAAAWGVDRRVWDAALQSRVPGERAISEWFRDALDDQIDWPDRSSVHDALSGRFLVQIFTSALSVATEAVQSVVRHTAQVDDNPVLCGNEVLTSGASLLCEVATKLSSLQVALAQVGRNIFNRCLMLTNGSLPGLTVNLVPSGIVGTGYGPLMKLAQEQAVRTAAAAAPVQIFNLTLAAGLEDEALHVPLIAERIEQQIEALDWLLVVEAVILAQALQIRNLEQGRLIEKLIAVVRPHFEPFSKDVPLSASLQTLRFELCGPLTRAQFRELSPLIPLDEDMAMSRARQWYQREPHKLSAAGT